MHGFEIWNMKNVINLGIFFIWRKEEERLWMAVFKNANRRLLKNTHWLWNWTSTAKVEAEIPHNCLFLTWSVFLQHTEYFSSCLLQTYFWIFIQMGIVCIWPSTSWWPWRSSLSTSASLLLIATHPPSQEGRILIWFTVFPGINIPVSFHYSFLCIINYTLSENL